MTNVQREAAEAIRSSDAVSANLKQLRARRGMTMKDLAARCRDLGAEQLTANVIASIEVRRRGVAVDELLVLALALDVAPAHLLTPADPAARIAITAGQVFEAEAVNQWIIGAAPLLPTGGTQFLQYAAERTAGSGQRTTDHAAALLRARMSGLVEQYDSEAQEFLGRVRRQVVDLVDYLQESVNNGVPSDELVQVLETVKTKVSPQQSATSNLT